MVTALGKSDASTSHAAGIGRVRERTIVIGSQVIAIDNIGSIQIVEGQRNWLMFILGLLLMAGSAAVAGSYGALAMVGVLAGLLLVILNLMQKVERGLSIGTCDGRAALIVSTDEAFLQRLLGLLIEKIDSRNDALVASFDITHNNISTGGGGVAIGDRAFASGAVNTEGGGAVFGDRGIASGAGGDIALGAPPAAEPSPPREPAPDEGDDALFAEPAPAAPPKPAPLPPAPAPEAAPVAPPIVRTAAARSAPHDSLLDGPAIDDDDRDFLSSPGRLAYRPHGSDHRGGGWILPILALLILGGGGGAAWFWFTQDGNAISLTLTPDPTPAEAVSAPTPATETPVTPEPAPEVAPESIPPAVEAPVTDDAATPPAEAEIAPASDAARSESTEFTPPEPMVARASGLRYRARPSSADNVAIIAETRAGGEPLQINGRSVQPDGEWYRVALGDGRPAWFKASLAVPRARFAETFAASSAQPLTFAAAAPRVLEPAEGVQIAGGAQPVRFAWSGPSGASIYIVEIETFDPVIQRWVEDTQFNRATVSDASELAAAIPRAGAWRWRVRGVTPSGEQSQFSRWSAFSLRE